MSETSEQQVALARAIAITAHAGQVDKLKNPHIDHPRRVANAFDPAVEHQAHCAAWLHDVVEDSPMTARQLLAAGVSSEIVKVVTLLTRDKDISDDEYYERIRKHPIARAVKLSDVADNSAPWRTSQLPVSLRTELAAKYARARSALWDYEVVPQNKWAAHPVLSELRHHSSYEDYEWHYYFVAVSELQLQRLRTIVLASAPPGSLDFMPEPAASARVHLPDAGDGADLAWFAGRPGERDWVALVPRGLCIERDWKPSSSPTADVVTDYHAKTLSDADRETYLYTAGHGNNSVALALGTLIWPDQKILEALNPSAANQRPYSGPGEPMDAEAITAYLQVADSEESITVPEPLWAAHPILGRLKSLSLGKYDSYFYFDEVTDQELRTFATIRFYSEDPDNSHFERMYPWGQDRDFPTANGICHAALWFAGRIWDERWTAEIPRQVDDLANAHVVTDLAAGTISNADRDAFLRRQSQDESLRSVQRARWQWPIREMVSQLASELALQSGAENESSTTTAVSETVPHYYENISGTSLYRWAGNAEASWVALRGWMDTDAVSLHRIFGHGWLDEITEEQAREKYPTAFQPANDEE